MDFVEREGKREGRGKLFSVKLCLFQKLCRVQFFHSHPLPLTLLLRLLSPPLCLQFSSFSASALSSHNVSHFRLTHARDPVPHLPPLAFGFHHQPTEVRLRSI
jgi:hypothetical protein